MKEVERIETPNPEFGPDYYYGGDAPPLNSNPELDDVDVFSPEDVRTAAHVHDLPTLGVAPVVDDDEYSGLSRDEMLKALNKAGYKHDLRKNASRVTVLAEYKKHFEPKA